MAAVSTAPAEVNPGRLHRPCAVKHTGMIHLVATITVAPGTRDEFLALFNAVVPTVLAEDGCFGYLPVVDIPANNAFQPPIRPDVVMVLEQWRDLAALDAHGQSPHMLAFSAKAKDLIRGLELLILTPAIGMA